MKNKKGFTLTEILVTIAIIGIILLIAIPVILGINKSIKTRAYEAKKVSIVAAAEEYAKNNSDEFGDATQIQVSVETLLSKGYIKSDYEYTEEECSRVYGCIANPINMALMNDDKILIKRVNSVVQATYDEEASGLLVYFNKNGATSIGADALSCMPSLSGTCTVQMPSIERNEYEILGWNNNLNSTVSSNNVGATMTVSESNAGSTYYAITSKPLTATFNKGYASSVTESEKTCNIYNTNTSCTVTAPSATRSGYTMKGWGTSSTTKTVLANVNATLTLSGNLTYYAITSKPLTATFAKNGASSIGSSSLSCDIYNNETACNITMPTITSSTNFTAKGWNTNQSATTVEYEVGQTATLTANRTFYAIQTTTCYIAAEIADTTCPSGYSQSGTNCTHSYTSTDLQLVWDDWANYCGTTPSGNVTCIGAGEMTKPRGCWRKGECGAGSPEDAYTDTLWSCRRSCGAAYMCSAGYSGGGNTSLCTKIIEGTHTYKCTSYIGSELSGSNCYKYNQLSCSSGWTSTK